MRLENFRGSDHDLRAIGNDFAPEFSPRVVLRGGHEPESTPSGIRSNVKQPVSRVRGQTRTSRGKRIRVFCGEQTRIRMMIRVIFVVFFSRSDEPEFSARLVGAQIPDLAGRMTRDGQEEKSSAPGAFHFNSKPLVGLII